MPVLLILSVVDDLYGDKKRITYWGAGCGLMVSRSPHVTVIDPLNKSFNHVGGGPIMFISM